MKIAAALILTTALVLSGAADAKNHKAKKVRIRAADQVAATNLTAFLPPPVTPANTWDLDLSDGGRVVIQLRPDKAPKMVERIKALTQQGFYNGLMFHRVISGFMAQGGDPKGTGEGGSTLPDVPAEFNDLPHVRGAVAAARANDPNSANSQFYIMFMPNLKLDLHYTVFGRVVSGMQYVDAIQKGEPPANPTRIVRAIMGDDPNVDTPPPPLPAAAPAAQAPAALPSGAMDQSTPPQGTPQQQ
ncbi:peptidylprolyl isomerase [Sphingomonas sp. CGMCC 1.13654]|uniref:Peptidyl-prolyl cis-trans isomerase n=1 Tax=Sphingomonas chungangi TaxID=2683589 RepID=A0A838LBY5_9SPHN|nr:peptidylprolyl isomerase [Sphingomonas chungangi]MBA2936370.1 peptidylprolyl isomerase [Sphingomonas chungangi]MVW55755.1 peptidylprolyl isomerase [Sphingomonas chungangi]